MSSIIHQLNLYRRYPYWSKAKCVYIHIPKAAGTSINKALYGRTLGHYQAIEIRKRFPELFNKSFVFSIVRNPWSRTYSAYKFAKMGRTESMGVKNPAQYQIPEFDSFEQFIFDWLMKKNTIECDYIFQPQHLFVCDNKGNLITDFIGKVENISNDFQLISTQLSREITLPFANKTSNINDYKIAYKSNEMIEAVAKIYRKDIELFEYQF